MKVSKSKGAQYDLTEPRIGQNLRTKLVRRACLWPRMHRRSWCLVHPRQSVQRIEQFVFVVCCHVSEPNRRSGPLLWLLSFGPANESDRRRGATRGLSRSETKASTTLSPKKRFSASNPTWNTPCPISSVSSRSRSSAQSNSALHSAKRALAVGDRRELQRGDVVVDAHRALEDRVGAADSRSPTASAAARGSCRRRAYGSGARSRPCRPARCSRCGSRRSPGATAAGR